MKNKLTIAVLFLTAFSSMADAAILKVSCKGRWRNDTLYSSATVIVQSGCESEAMEKGESECFSKVEQVNLAASEDKEITNVEINGSFNEACCK